MAAQPMNAPDWRYVTPAEQDLIHGVFGSAVTSARVRVFCQPFVTRTFTPGSWGIVYPDQEALWDFTEGDLRQRSTFVHEFTHVWQAQNGRVLPYEKLRAGDDDQAYDYLTPQLELAAATFSALNIEQQAAFVEDAYVLSQGGAVRRDAAFYADLGPSFRQA